MVALRHVTITLGDYSTSIKYARGDIKIMEPLNNYFHMASMQSELKRTR